MGFVYLVLAAPALASEMRFPTPAGPTDVVGLADLETKTYWHGELAGFPHSYQLVIEDPTEVSFALRAPATAAAATTSRVIVVRQERRGVAEVLRLTADGAPWELVRDWRGPHRYLVGPQYTGELAPGIYILEVSTPDNLGQYTLVSGTEEQPWYTRPLATLGEVHQTNRFFGYSPLRLVLSPLIWVPVFIIVLGWWYRRRLKRHV
jgi:hypothetical protein